MTCFIYRSSSHESECCREQRKRAGDENGADWRGSGCSSYSTSAVIISAKLAIKEKEARTIPTSAWCGRRAARCSARRSWKWSTYITKLFISKDALKCGDGDDGDKGCSGTVRMWARCSAVRPVTTRRHVCLRSATPNMKNAEENGTNQMNHQPRLTAVRSRRLAGWRGRRCTHFSTFRSNTVRVRRWPSRCEKPTRNVSPMIHDGVADPGGTSAPWVISKIAPRHRPSPTVPRFRSARRIGHDGPPKDIETVN